MLSTEVAAGPGPPTPAAREERPPRPPGPGSWLFRLAPVLFTTAAGGGGAGGAQATVEQVQGNASRQWARRGSIAVRQVGPTRWRETGHRGQSRRARAARAVAPGEGSCPATGQPGEVTGRDPGQARQLLPGDISHSSIRCTASRSGPSPAGFLAARPHDPDIVWQEDEGTGPAAGDASAAALG